MTFQTTIPAFSVRERAARTLGCEPVAVRGPAGRGRQDHRPEDQRNRVEGQKPRTRSGAGP